jgi:hypothetical protein
MLVSIKRSFLRKLLTALPLTLAFTLLFVAVDVVAQDEAQETPKPAKLFEMEETLDVTIAAPWNQIVRNKKNQDPYAATMTYTDELGNALTLPLTVERRGVKRQELCKFPPIRLRFNKEDVKGTTFRGQKSLKMVTHCEERSVYEQYYVVEMLIYQLYRHITDYSFRIRPLNITYADAKSGKGGNPKFAFLIEDDSDVAKRHDLKKLETPRVKYRRLEPDLTSIFTLFQYMIGNVDWAALRGPDPEECCHNVKLIAPEPLAETDWIYPIPYDFDSAGLVNAKYAAPPDGLPIRRVTQRLFRGYCWHDETLPAARDLILEKEAGLMAIVANETRLSKKTRGSVEDYLADFFEIVRDPKDFQKEIRDECRGKSKQG